jgi:hypothetical protein
VTSTSRPGPSRLYVWNESSCSLTLNGSECAGSWMGVVVSADVWRPRAKNGATRGARAARARVGRIRASADADILDEEEREEKEKEGRRRVALADC